MGRSNGTPLSFQGKSMQSVCGRSSFGSYTKNYDMDYPQTTLGKWSVVNEIVCIGVYSSHNRLYV